MRSSIAANCKLVMVCLLLALIALISLIQLATSAPEHPHSNFRIASRISRGTAIAVYFLRTPRDDSYCSTSNSRISGSYSQPMPIAGPEDTDGLSPMDCGED